LYCAEGRTKFTFFCPERTFENDFDLNLVFLHMIIIISSLIFSCQFWCRAVPREVRDRDIISDTASLAIDHGAGPKPGRRSHNRSILQRAASAKTFDSRWDVKTGLNVPTSFRLDRPVQIDRTETQVASAMANYLRDASISARFDDEKAEALGTTFGGTQFAIRLFKADDPGCTIVEIQRRDGCSLEFNKERSALIAAAKGETPGKKRPKFSIPQSLKGKVPPPSDERIKDRHDQILKELSNTSRCRRSQLSQLEIVSSMCDQEKAGKETAHKVAKMVMSGDLRIICLHWIKATPTDVVSRKIKLYSLLTICKCLDVLSDSGSIKEIFADDIWFTEQLYPVLFKTLEDMDCPHVVCLVSKCVTYLLKNCPGLGNEEKSQLRPCLEKAKSWGTTSHKNLENAATAACRVLN
jgi:hypothetical protein